ncbi:MAG: hypothetical protein ACYC6G_20095 [Desulfobaccales bacterium]
MENPVPTIGRTVLFRLTKEQAKAINRRRFHAHAHLDEHIANSNGVQIHVGNEVKEGDAFPMVITRVWGDTPQCCVNGQVMLDGNDLFWVTSTQVGEGPNTFSWPQKSA